MLKRHLLANAIVSGSLLMLSTATIAAAAHDPSSSEFREALISTCDGKPADVKGNCLRGRTLVFDMRNTQARAKRQACLNGGGTPALCDAKQEKYWKDLKKMFGL